MYLVHSVIFVIGITQTVATADFSWCQYKFYTDSLSWFEAKAACERDNLTLAEITNGTQLSYVRHLMTSHLPSLDANPPESLWIGAYRAQNDEARWQDGCGHVDDKHVQVPTGGNEACFLFIDDSTFASESCSDEQPFLCQASTLDTETCFTNTAAVFNAALDTVTNTIAYVKFVDYLTSCFQIACQISDCVGVRLRDNSNCIPLTHRPGSIYTKGDTKYIRDLLRSAPSGVTASVSHLENLCTTSMTTPNQWTHSSESSTIYALTTTEAGITELEPSSTGSTAVVGMTSESTPPLSNVVTSVKLEVTSLPTVTENTATRSVTCSLCSCLRPTSIDQSKLEESISELKEQLLINPKKLSSYKRTLTSAPDDRKSAANIGYVGVLVLCLVPGVIILLDMGRLIREFKQFTLRVRNSQCTASKITPIDRERI